MRLLSPAIGALLRPASLAAMSYVSAPSTVDELLARCPTAAEIASIDRDFQIVFDDAAPPIACSRGGNEYGSRLAVYNALRVAKLVTFDRPVPTTGRANLYDWLRDGQTDSPAPGRGLRRIRISSKVSRSAGDGLGSIVLLTDTTTDAPKRYWMGAGDYGLADLLALIVHEARHWMPVTGVDSLPAMGPVHDAQYPCGSGEWTNDASMARGGAWATQVWTHIWFARHSGSFLGAAQRKGHERVALRLSKVVFCDQADPPLNGETRSLAFPKVDREVATAVRNEAPFTAPRSASIGETTTSSMVLPWVALGAAVAIPFLFSLARPRGEPNYPPRRLR